MNIIAIDIGNSTIKIALFIGDAEKFIESVGGADDNARTRIAELLESAWAQIPWIKNAKVKKRDGVIVASSVKPAWTEMVSAICSEKLDEKIRLIGRDVPLPIDTAVDDSMQVGTDRLVAAAAAYAVTQNAVVIADVGTAVTIDLVDEDGLFMGGVIYPGFDITATALQQGTARLPKVTVSKPKGCYGANTVDAINCGLYYGVIGLLETIIRRYAEELGFWPQTILTGGASSLIKDDCDFIDSWVSDLTVRGVVVAYKKYLAEQEFPANDDDGNKGK
jgi:type III pantothenate kinase